MDNSMMKKVFDAGANVIWPEMKKLRGQAPEQKGNTRRRWVWELIQNASDCTPYKGKIDINISINNESELEFSHNGDPFTYLNLVDLITQISSKERKIEELTGKFGTGFISTHLLSEKVNISGVFKQSEYKYKNLNFMLNRGGASYAEIRDNIKETLNLIELLNQDDDTFNYEQKEWSTKFTYKDCNSQETIEAIRIGLDDLNRTIPFVLALNTSISSIKFDGFEFKVMSSKPFKGNKIVEITKTLNNKTIECFSILIKSENEVSVVVSVQETNDQKLSILPYPDNVPKLFCKFPLVGTENFSFPVIVNCPKFEVERDRNGIYEGNQENQDYLNTAVKLYEELINLASIDKWLDMYNLCYMSKANNSSFQMGIFKTIKQTYEQLPIVDVNLNGVYFGRAEMKSKEFKDRIGVPVSYEPEELNNEFWEIVNSFATFYIPTKDTYLQWLKVSECKIDITYINDFYIKNKNLEDFKRSFNGKNYDLNTWLNKYYHFWIRIKGEEGFAREVWVLNQNKKFVEISKISIDDNIDDELKGILIALGDNIAESLLVKEVKLPEHIVKMKIDNKFVAKKIQAKINQILSDETLNNKQRNSDDQIIFNRLTIWFLEHPELSEEIFEQLYNKRNLLSTPEETIRRFKIAEKIESKGIKYEQLDDIINES